MDDFDDYYYDDDVDTRFNDDDMIDDYYYFDDRFNTNKGAVKKALKHLVVGNEEEAEVSISCVFLTNIFIQLCIYIMNALYIGQGRTSNQ